MTDEQYREIKRTSASGPKILALLASRVPQCSDTQDYFQFSVLCFKKFTELSDMYRLAIDVYDRYEKELVKDLYWHKEHPWKNLWRCLLTKLHSNG